MVYIYTKEVLFITRLNFTSKNHYLCEKFDSKSKHKSIHL